MINWDLPDWARAVERAVVEPHSLRWVFDIENPPAYLCEVEGCEAFTDACEVCEEPCPFVSSAFCSLACEDEADEREAAEEFDPLACPGCGGNCLRACR